MQLSPFQQSEAQRLDNVLYVVTKVAFGSLTQLSPGFAAEHPDFVTRAQRYITGLEELTATPEFDLLERDTAAHSADGAMNIEVAIEDAQATLRSSRRTVGTRKRPVVVGSGADVEEDAASAAGDAGVETQSSRVGVTTRSQRSTVGLRGREPPIQVQAERHVSVRAGKKRKETHGDEDDDRSESAIEAASAEHQHAPMNTDAGVGAPSTRSRSSKTQDYRSLTPRPQRDSSSLPLSPPLSLRFGAAQQSEECSPSADGQAESGDSSSGSRESTVDDSHPHSRFQEDLRRLWARGQEIPGSIEPEPDRKEHANSDEVVDSDTYLVDDESTYSEEGVVVPDESAFNDEDVSSHRERVNNENVVNDKPVNNTKRRSRKGVPKPKHIVDAVAIEELVNLSHNNKAFIRKVVTDPTLQSAKDLISLGMLVIMLESVDQPTDASRQETISPIKQMSQNSSASLMYIARQHKSRAPLIDAIWKLYLAICASKLYETYPQEFAHVSREKHRRLAFDMTIAADIDVLKEEGYNVKDLEKEYLGANTRKRDHVFRGAHKILYLFMELGPQVLFTLGRGAGRTALGKKKIRLGDKKGLMTLVTYDNIGYIQDNALVDFCRYYMHLPCIQAMNQQDSGDDFTDILNSLGKPGQVISLTDIKSLKIPYPTPRGRSVLNPSFKRRYVES